MNNLQKTVILGVFLVAGIYLGMNWDKVNPNNDANTQIDPPSMDLDAGPDDTDVDSSPEPVPPVIEIPAPSPAPEPIACTADAKICPDGSAVGRVGPNCEFAPCPEPVACTDDALQCPDGSFVSREGPLCEFPACPPVGSISCTPEQKAADVCTMEYAPVCGLVEVQCITTPCNPVPETFGNACGACASGNVSSYTVGACGNEQ